MSNAMPHEWYEIMSALRDDPAVARDRAEHGDVGRHQMRRPPRGIDLQGSRLVTGASCEFTEERLHEHRRKHCVAGSEVGSLPGCTDLHVAVHAEVRRQERTQIPQQLTGREPSTC